MNTNLAQVESFDSHLVDLMVNENRADVLKKLAMIYSVVSPVFGVDNQRESVYT